MHVQCSYYNAMDLIREGNGANQTICRQTNKTEKIAYIYRCILVCIMHAKGVPGLWVAHTHTHTQRCLLLSDFDNFRDALPFAETAPRC